MTALKIETVLICADTIGDKWTVKDRDRLVQLIAIIAMGQAKHAANIIQTLKPAAPILTLAALKEAATEALTIPPESPIQRTWKRDGFLFEAISWIAAHQQSSDRVFIKDPHLSSTTQGIDGLMIELDTHKDIIVRATIFEDKCSENPESIFASKVLPGFKEHHFTSKRAPELLSTAALMLANVIKDSEKLTEAAATVLELAYRRYRASLAITKADDSQTRRQKVFKNYKKLKDIKQQQRLGSNFLVTSDLRPYFDKLANDVIQCIKKY